MNLKYVWLDRRYLVNKKLENLLIHIVWKLPERLVMWAAVRVIANATTGKYENQVVPELTALEALNRWPTR
jgi:hypothetical protein